MSQLGLQTIALETAAEAIMITDAEGVMLWVNPAFTTTTGYTAEEAIGKTPRILKSGTHTDTFYRTFWKTIRAGETWRSEFVNRHKDGHIYYGEHTVTPVRDAIGTVTHFVGIMHDVTEARVAEVKQRELDKQLHHSQKLEALGTLAGGAAHELNNDLLLRTGLRRTQLERPGALQHRRGRV